MKICAVLILGIALLLAPFLVTGEEPAAPETAPQKPAEKLELQSLEAKASYAIGLTIGRNFKTQGVEVDVDALAGGLRHAFSGAKPLLEDDELEEVMAKFQAELAAKQAERAKVEGEANKKEGEAFLAANKEKPGVKTLSSGLQYEVIQAGTGAKPEATDTVKTHYRGTLVDGTEFDSSYDNGEPVTFRVDQVIPGWKEALQLMPVGSKWRLFIPSDLAYGARGAGDRIGPHETLVFEIELISIED